MSHIMVDTETLGTKAGCVIRSIGACEFDPVRGLIGAKFYANITRESCEAVGLTVDPKTELWWSQQSEAARADLEADQIPLDQALSDFGGFYLGKEGVQLWSHGPSFDETILSAAYAACSLRTPWKYSSARCTRTIYDVGRALPDRAQGVHHNALTDAIIQAEAVIRAYANLGLSKVA